MAPEFYLPESYSLGTFSGPVTKGCLYKDGWSGGLWKGGGEREGGRRKGGGGRGR